MNETAIAVRTEGETYAYAPMSFSESWQIAKIIAESGAYRSWDKPQKVWLAHQKAADLGMPLSQALESFDFIEGKLTIKPTAAAALIMNSPKKRQFRCIETTMTRCTYRAQRVDEDEPQDISFTWEEAERMGLTRKDNWKRMPAQMLAARAAIKAARLVFPDVIQGLYTTDEMQEVVEAKVLPSPPKEKPRPSHKRKEKIQEVIDATFVENEKTSAVKVNDPQPDEIIGEIKILFNRACEYVGREEAIARFRNEGPGPFAELQTLSHAELMKRLAATQELLELMQPSDEDVLAALAQMEAEIELPWGE